jgi:hypothetical protein
MDEIIRSVGFIALLSIYFVTLIIFPVWLSLHSLLHVLQRSHLTHKILHLLFSLTVAGGIIATYRTNATLWHSFLPLLTAIIQTAIARRFSVLNLRR